ncbi:uncharacterized protein RAG0_00424 [Rhynchosporium agropyri]|uniref:Uncharacterized protein n=1 Tax=Rhynchosporium agropyri TaxID=914238 RepID=A0A1E1JT05_9HELO|nr:uncharacterized protein RAG0_00424 [Rhynchosporium agropyri]
MNYNHARRNRPELSQNWRRPENSTSTPATNMNRLPTRHPHRSNIGERGTPALKQEDLSSNSATTRIPIMEWDDFSRDLCSKPTMTTDMTKSNKTATIPPRSFNTIDRNPNEYVRLGANDKRLSWVCDMGDSRSGNPVKNGIKTTVTTGHSSYITCEGQFTEENLLRNNTEDKSFRPSRFYQWLQEVDTDNETTGASRANLDDGAEGADITFPNVKAAAFDFEGFDSITKRDKLLFTKWVISPSYEFEGRTRTAEPLVLSDEETKTPVVNLPISKAIRETPESQRAAFRRWVMRGYLRREREKADGMRTAKSIDEGKEHTAMLFSFDSDGVKAPVINLPTSTTESTALRNTSRAENQIEIEGEEIDSKKELCAVAPTRCIGEPRVPRPQR